MLVKDGLCLACKLPAPWPRKGCCCMLHSLRGVRSLKHSVITFSYFWFPFLLIAADNIKGQVAMVELGEELDEHGPCLNSDCPRYVSEPDSKDCMLPSHWAPYFWGWWKCLWALASVRHMKAIDSYVFWEVNAWWLPSRGIWSSRNSWCLGWGDSTTRRQKREHSIQKLSVTLASTELSK